VLDPFVRDGRDMMILFRARAPTHRFGLGQNSISWTGFDPLLPFKIGPVRAENARKRA
jgi:hypothetical protein